MIEKLKFSGLDALSTNSESYSLIIEGVSDSVEFITGKLMVPFISGMN